MLPLVDDGASPHDGPFRIVVVALLLLTELSLAVHDALVALSRAIYKTLLFTVGCRR